MKTKIMIWISTLFAAAFISLATAEKAGAQPSIVVTLQQYYIPALPNSPHQCYIEAVVNQPIGTSITIQGEYIGKLYYLGGGSNEIFIPFTITIPANASSSGRVLIYSNSTYFEFAGYDIWSYTPTSWNGSAIVVY